VADQSVSVSFELTSLPCSLFVHGFLRKCNKSILAQELRGKTETAITAPKSDSYVVDGGYLLHKVKWKSGNNYSQVIDQYLWYVSRHFGVDVRRRCI